MSKSIRKTIRFSEQEFSQIEKNLHGKSFSNFAREILLNGKIKVSKIQKVDQDLIYHLNRIGNNLNQIARAANSEDDKIQILTELLEIEKDLKQCM